MTDPNACRLPSHGPDPMVDQILGRSRVVAVVGMSRKPERPSHYVAAYLHEQGYRVVPITPQADELLGQRCYTSLRDVPADVRVDAVCLFRKPEDVGPFVDDAIAIGAGYIWMQQGIVNESAAARAREAGLGVVMDRCMMVEHRARR